MLWYNFFNDTMYNYLLDVRAILLSQYSSEGKSPCYLQEIVWDWGGSSEIFHRDSISMMPKELGRQDPFLRQWNNILRYARAYGKC